MVDIASSAIRPETVWRSLGRSLAVAAGALSALLSLLAGTAVSTACFRGAIALFGVLILTRIGAAALASLDAAEQRAEEQEAARLEAALDENELSQ